MTLTAKLEACLASVSKPLSVQALAELLDTAPDDIKQALNQLELDYSLSASRGLTLLRSKQSAQLLTHKEAGEFVQQLHQKDTEGELSDVAMETLSIIAYAGPISREAIEDIRGVSCVQIIRNLRKRGLVESSKGAFTTYSLSTNALRYLGLTSAEQLPDFESLQASIASHVRPEPTTTEPTKPTTESISE